MYRRIAATAKSRDTGKAGWHDSLLPGKSWPSDVSEGNSRTSISNVRGVT
jgi:hypothetical protein